MALLFIPLNALLPVFLAVSFLDLITMLFSLLQPLKAFLPICFTLVPIESFSNFLLPFKAFFAIEVTLYLLPENFIDAGIIIFFTFFLTPVNFTDLMPVTDVTVYFKLLTTNLSPVFTVLEVPPGSGLFSGIPVSWGIAGVCVGAVVGTGSAVAVGTGVGVSTGTDDGARLGAGVFVVPGAVGVIVAAGPGI